MSHPLTLRNRDGKSIATLDDWTRPKIDVQWKQGRSAMELGRAWLESGRPQTPPEIERLLTTNPLTSGTLFVEGQPEFVTPLPERGEGRNHDLKLVGRSNDQKIIACIEAKADEEFGERIGDYYRQAINQTRPTRAPERIRSLLRLVFGESARPDEKPWSDLRYQLLTGVAGTLLQAQKESAKTALFIVQEFYGESVEVGKVVRNAADYAHFVEIVFGADSAPVKEGIFYGPKTFDDSIELLMGKASRQLSQ